MGINARIYLKTKHQYIETYVIIFRMKALFYILLYKQYIFGKYMYTLSV